MAEVVKRTNIIPYRGFEAKFTSLMDQSVVQFGSSYSADLGISTKTMDWVLQNGARGYPYQGHNGVDTVGRWQEKIYAIPCENNIVKKVEYNDIRGHWVEYGNNRTTVRQCHFARLDVKVGQKLTADTVIGIEGSTGKVSGKHLHTSVIINGLYADPYYYLTGLLALPNETKTKKKVYQDTDAYEYTLDKPEIWFVDTSVKKGINIRKRPGVNFDIVGGLAEKKVITIDRRADFPDGQKWARLKDKPWHWVCLFDPDMQDGSGEWLCLRK